MLGETSWLFDDDVAIDSCRDKNFAFFFCEHIRETIEIVSWNKNAIVITIDEQHTTTSRRANRTTIAGVRHERRAEQRGRVAKISTTRCKRRQRRDRLATRPNCKPTSTTTVTPQPVHDSTSRATRRHSHTGGEPNIPFESFAVCFTLWFFRCCGAVAQHSRNLAYNERRRVSICVLFLTVRERR
jgi:hypothetical protein